MSEKGAATGSSPAPPADDGGGPYKPSGTWPNVPLGDPNDLPPTPPPGPGVGGLVKDAIDKDKSKGNGKVGKAPVQHAGVFRRPVIFVGTGAVVIGAGVTVAVLLSGGGGRQPSGGSRQSAAVGPASAPAAAPASVPPRPGGAASSSTTSTTVAQPQVQPIQALFTESARTTVYTANVSASEALTYRWGVTMSADPGCASGFSGGAPTANQATWYHADITQDGPCDHNLQGPQGHPGVVTLTVTSAHWTCVATYSGTNSGPGDPPVCRPTS